MAKRSQTRFVKRKSTPRVRDGKVSRKNPRDVQGSAASPLQVWTDAPRWPNRHALCEKDILKFVGLLPEWDQLSQGLEEIVLADRDESEVDGWYSPGIVAICAVPENLRENWYAIHYEGHRQLLQRLNVPCSRELKHCGCWRLSQAFFLDMGGEYDAEPDLTLNVTVIHEGSEWSLRDDQGVELLVVARGQESLDVYDVTYDCNFNEDTMRAYLLLHILLHELGHHRDCMTAPDRGSITRGESYAEQYALRHGDEIWNRYLELTENG